VDHDDAVRARGFALRQSEPSPQIDDLDDLSAQGHDTDEPIGRARDAGDRREADDLANALDGIA
jgi:hypothetical protein